MKKSTKISTQFSLRKVKKINNYVYKFIIQKLKQIKTIAEEWKDGTGKAEVEQLVQFGWGRGGPTELGVGPEAELCYGDSAVMALP